jgi:hypothetical protein
MGRACGRKLLWQSVGTHGRALLRANISVINGNEERQEERGGERGQGKELNQTTEDWHTLVGAILVIAHRKAAPSRANTRFAPTRGLNAVYQCHVV